MSRVAAAMPRIFRTLRFKKTSVRADNAEKLLRYTQIVRKWVNFRNFEFPTEGRPVCF